MSENGKIYNPLDKRNLGESVAEALLESPVHSLPIKNSFLGAGIYALYYFGDYPAYKTIAARNVGNKFEQPIYVGKAIPSGGRKGGFDLEGNSGEVLFKRLNEHAESIQCVKNLDIKNFACRYLVVDDIWIPLGESLLISKFNPLWNVKVDGFGNHDPGSGRYSGMRPSWDTLHPGRNWAEKCQPSKKSENEIQEDVLQYFRDNNK